MDRAQSLSKEPCSRWRRAGTECLFFAILLALVFQASAAQQPADYFKIVVVDQDTGRGVPLVELRTTNDVSHYTDSNGIVAFYEPGLMGQTIYFFVKSDGYEVPQDMFGYRGVALQVVPGGSALIKIKRTNIAERLYRITGQGIYRDSVLVGQAAPLKRPVLNGGVMGQDGGLAAVYRGKIFWIWGDTGLPSRALGNFSSSGATSELPGQGGLDPSVGIDLTYFTDESGFSKGMCAVPGPGPKWLTGLVTVRDQKGEERLLAEYMRMKDLGHAYERGFVIFNDATQQFQPLAQFPVDGPLADFSGGHPIRIRVAGGEYFYEGYTPPFVTRVRADLEHIRDSAAYEFFTPLVADAAYDKSDPKLDRQPDGHPRYSWKTGTPPLSFDQQRELIASGKMTAGESLYQLRSFDTAAGIKPHAGSIFWNDFRRRWTMIVKEDEGLSNHGIIWFAEADTPLGPWVYAQKVVSHENRNFYNPAQRPFFNQDGGRLIYFDGTYVGGSGFFAPNNEVTPYYNYNQIMYRLALDDPRLFLPVPVYQVTSADGLTRYLLREGVESRNEWRNIKEISFFALPPDRRRAGLVPVFATMSRRGMILSLEPPATTTYGQPFFYALPAKQEESGETIAGTWNCTARDSEGSEFPFTLEIRVEGEIVRGRLDQDEIAEGTYREGRIEFRLKQGNDRFRVVGRLQGGKLIGDWTETSTGKTGTWEGKADQSGVTWKKSSDITPLYEYLNADGTRIYSTQSKTSNQRLQRSADPICRVWQNPMSLLILDLEAKPSPTAQ